MLKSFPPFMCVACFHQSITQVCVPLPTPSCPIQLEHIKGAGAKANVDPALLHSKVPSKLSTDRLQLRQQSQPYCYLSLQFGVFITAR